MIYGLIKVLSQWMMEHSDVIQTGYQLIDQILTILLTTSMFIAMVIGCVLDNTIPGNSNCYTTLISMFQNKCNAHTLTY